MKNFPNTLQIGDVRNVKASDLPKIDLLIGGSPCQGFSSSGKRLNFDDPRSALFFEYVRILKELREINPDIKFLLENVKMKKEWVAVISEILGVEPVEINSALVSAQNRKRLYWANFYISQPADRGILLKDILEDGDTVAGMRGRYLNEDGTRDDVARPKIVQCIENRLDGKSNTLTTVSKDNLVFVGHTGKSKRTNGNTVRAYRQGERIFVVNGKNPTLSAQMGGTANGTGLITEDLLHYRNLTITECERLQTMPDGYTSVAPKTARTKMIGNGWTIDVITHILNFLKSNLQNQF
jgi:DNA (cytosine-5)-methyltransferase 3A